jgi:hypothetical protein
MRTLVGGTLLLAAVLAAPATVAVYAQNDLDTARSRYEEAAYEDALKLLDALSPASPDERVQIEQYRALCHIALGHTEQAERAVSALVDADPTYVLPSTIASPKVLGIVAETRRRQLPTVARKVLDSARAAYAEKKTALAREQFTLLLKLLDDPAMADRPERADYRTLAEGFVSLLAAPPAAAAPSAPNPGPSTSAPATNGGSTAAAKPTAPAPLRSFTPAVPVQEVLPPWTPPNPSVAKNAYEGSLKVVIGADGRVKSATIVKPSHPAYDAVLLGVARSWRYKPAVEDGNVTESERIIAVKLKPR